MSRGFWTIFNPFISDMDVHAKMRHMLPPAPPMPPMLREPSEVLRVRELKRTMLLACLTGGMTYEAAKSATDLEFSEDMAKAEKDDAFITEINNLKKENYKEAGRLYETALMGAYKDPGAVTEMTP